MTRLTATIFLLFFFVSFIDAAENGRVVTKNISYYPAPVLESSNDEYQKEQCLLDISVPKSIENANDNNVEKPPVVVWFHGGGLSGGRKSFPKLLEPKNIVLVGVGYRLFPKAKDTQCIEDAAAAVAWTFANIEKYGGNPKRIFVAGNSAGGYLTGMVGFDPSWLKPYDIDTSQIAGLVLLTGQVSTHFQMRKELQKTRQKYPKILQQEYAVIVDEFAPLYHLSKNVPPTLLLLGDRKIEWKVRVEENEMLYATLRAMKHPHVEFYEHPGFNHGQMGSCEEAFERMSRFIEGQAGE